MDKKICALEFATYLVRLNWYVYVSCSSYVDVSIHFDSIDDVSKFKSILFDLKSVYHFEADFVARSDEKSGFYVCHCRFN